MKYRHNRWVALVLTCVFGAQTLCPLSAAAAELPTSPSVQVPGPSDEDRHLQAQAEVDGMNALLELSAFSPEAAAPQSAPVFDDPRLTLPPAVTLTQQALAAAVRAEAEYTVAAQFLSPGHPAHGAINNVYGSPTWVVPRENALAILGLIEAAETTGDTSYLDRAALAADYLIRVQDPADGGWFDQYSYADVHTRSKSPTQTAEVMIALHKLGYSPARAAAMKKGAEFLMSLQDPANKTGIDDGLVGGGKDADGNYQTWRWASDNSFAYWALRAASIWARVGGDAGFADQAATSASRILNGINDHLYISDPSDDDYGVWKRAIDASGAEAEPDFHEWINYAPQMLDLPATGVDDARVGEWIHAKFQRTDGAVVWNDTWHTTRKSPGFSFQAALVWYDLAQTAYANAAVNWALGSGLLQTGPDVNGIPGGWIDWIEPADQAPFWQRFIDTSFYATAAFKFGYDFVVNGGPTDLLLAHLQGSADLRADFKLIFGIDIPASGKITPATRGRLYDIALAPGFDVEAFVPALRNTAALVRGLASAPVREDFNLMFGTGITGVTSISVGDLQKLFAVGGDPGFSAGIFWSALTRAAALVRSLRLNASDRNDFNLLYGQNLGAAGVLSDADRSTVFGVVGSPGYVQSSYLAVMRRTAALLRDLRANSTHRYNFNLMFGASVASGTAPSAPDLTKLFAVGGDPGFNRTVFLGVLTRASALWAVLRSNAAYRADFNLLYGTSVSTSTALATADRTRLFGVAGTPGFVQSSYLPVLTKTAQLYRSFQASSTRRSDFNLLYGTQLKASGAPSGFDLAKLFGVAGGSGFNISVYLKALTKAADLVIALRGNTAKRNAFNKKYKVSLTASGPLNAATLTRVFGIVGGKTYNQTKFLASLK